MNQASAFLPIAEQPPAHWVILDGTNIIDITYSNFIINGIEYPQSTLQQPDENLFALGLYKLINNLPTIGDFQHAILKPTSEWTVDNTAKIVIMEYTIQNHIWIDIHSMILSRLKQLLDNLAQQRGYDNILEAVSYVNSASNKFKTEAQHCMQIRDAVWTVADDFITKVNGGLLPVPTSMSQIIDLMPSITWPD